MTSRESPWLDRRVIAYAHQGGAWEGPSSTIHAISSALARGATAVELDVHATKDRHLVVSHDETVDRTTDGAGTIAELTLNEVLALDNAYWWAPGADVSPGLPEDAYPLRGRAPDDVSLGIAPLSAVLELLAGVVVNLDIKRTAPEVEPYEALLADELRRLGRSDDTIVASFSDTAIAAFRAVAPEFFTSLATLETAEFYRAVHAGTEVPRTGGVALQVPASFGEITVVDAQFVEAAHHEGLAVHVWTINDTDEMRRLVDLGVDGIISDTPTALVGVLEASGCAWGGLGR
ncbi:MAG TPA: glycerophosphodiester phosphodiesterase [Acidimicrobiales bacterium]|nr:glycerophosphodiester phosphodiesterase [Acidimicrobiales bacterium]